MPADIQALVCLYSSIYKLQVTAQTGINIRGKRQRICCQMLMLHAAVWLWVAGGSPLDQWASQSATSSACTDASSASSDAAAEVSELRSASCPVVQSKNLRATQAGNTSSASFSYTDNDASNAQQRLTGNLQLTTSFLDLRSLTRTSASSTGGR